MKLKLNPSQLFSHYGALLVYGIPVLVFAWGTIQSQFKGSSNGTRSVKEIALVSIVLLIVGSLEFIRKRNKLKFKEYCILVDDKGFVQSVEKTAEQLNWSIDQLSASYVKAHRDGNWSWSWGEMITVIRDGEKILINSISDPNSLIAGESFGWNRKNVDTFIRNLHKAQV